MGAYQISPGALFYVTRQDDHISVRMFGEEPWKMFPDSENHFFSKAVDVQLTFPSDGAARFSQVVLRQ